MVFAQDSDRRRAACSVCADLRAESDHPELAVGQPARATAAAGKCESERPTGHAAGEPDASRTGDHWNTAANESDSDESAAGAPGDGVGQARGARHGSAV